nr:hypothetical protein [Mycobacterium sp. D16R24]
MTTTSTRNLGLDAQMPHDQRYDIADEYLQVCYKLWEGSWEAGAVVRDLTRDLRRFRPFRRTRAAPPRAGAASSGKAHAA